jgi:hypothetical protein
MEACTCVSPPRTGAACRQWDCNLDSSSSFYVSLCTCADDACATWSCTAKGLSYYSARLGFAALGILGTGVQLLFITDFCCYRRSGNWWIPTILLWVTVLGIWMAATVAGGVGSLVISFICLGNLALLRDLYLTLLTCSTPEGHNPDMTLCRAVYYGLRWPVRRLLSGPASSAGAAVNTQVPLLHRRAVDPAVAADRASMRLGSVGSLPLEGGAATASSAAPLRGGGVRPAAAAAAGKDAPPCYAASGAADGLPPSYQQLSTHSYA